MEGPNYKKTKFACYSAYFTMSSVFSLPPLLFVTFHEMYGISWTLLGTLVLINFCTQFAIDTVFTIFSKRFNIRKVIIAMPLITSFGLLVYSLFPIFFPQFAYVGLAIGTVIFSVASGLCEVLLSPTIAALPSDDPKKDMSFLHALYAMGVLTVVIIGTLFIKLIGSENWMYLTIFFAILPIISSVLFMVSPFPEMSTGNSSDNAVKSKNRTVGIILCVLCIFLGSCSENAMSNWVSSFLEAQLHLDKAIGDILGMAGFALLLMVVRLVYGKWGKNIIKVLLFSMLGASVCYLIVGLSDQAILSLIACALTGIFTSMLWPGTLIMMEENIPSVGVTAYALMAAGGDFGASVAPQLLGIVADHSSLQVGMLVCSAFPILGVVLLIIIQRFFNKNRIQSN